MSIFINSKSFLVPSAQVLSQPGALQEYVDTMLADYGVCPLPQGEIIYEAPLVIRRLQGGRIEGVGNISQLSTQSSNFLGNGVNYGTRLLPSNSDQPAIQLESIYNVNLSNFSVQTSGVGILNSFESGWGSKGNRLTKVSFLGNSIGFQAAEANGQDCSDIVFSQCEFAQCTTGFVCKSDDSENFVFTDMCKWIECGTCINMEKSGQVYVNNGYALRGNKLLEIGGAGTNKHHLYSINNFSWRRSINVDPFPVIVDAAAAESNHMQVIATGLSVNAGENEGVGTDHRYFIMPPLAEQRPWQVLIAGPVQSRGNSQLAQVKYGA